MDTIKEIPVNANKLELKHIIPHFSYGMNWIITCDNMEEDFGECEFPSGTLNKGTIWELFILTTDSFDFFGCECEYFAFKDKSGTQIPYTGGINPLLRPLSDLLNKELDFWIELGEIIGTMTPEYFVKSLIEGTDYSLTTKKHQNVSEYLDKNHFDWRFGLIKKGLAVDINTLNT